MNIDLLDISIINILLSGSKCTTSQIAKLILPSKNNRELRGSDVKVRYRLRKLFGADIVKREKYGSKTLYFIDIEKIIYGTGYIVIHKPNDINGFKMSFKNALVIKGDVYDHIIASY